MKDLKSKNIFSSFLYDRKTLSISNIITKFGGRAIDVLITFPIGIIKENLIKHLDLKYLDSLVNDNSEKNKITTNNIVNNNN